MHKLAVVVLLGLVSLILAVDPPGFTSTVSQPQNVTLRYSSVIGANGTGEAGGSGIYNDIAADSYYRPQGLAWFPQSNYSSKLGGPGLFTTDSSYERAEFFNQNNLNMPTSYNILFGAPDATTQGYDGYYSIDFTTNGVYAMVGDGTVYYWNYTSINNNQINSNAFPNPDAVFGNNSVTSGLGQYAALYSAEGIATKKSTGEIFVADSGCSRIAVYPPSVNSNNQAPSYAIGQNDTTLCDYYYCSTYSQTTCLYSPTWITFDCYDGLWVYDAETYAFYYFPNNSRIATFAFNGTDDLTSRFDTSYGLISGPSCNYLTFLGYDSVFIFQVNYATVAGVYQPTSVSSVVTFGEYYSSGSNVDYSTTSSLYSPHGAAYANSTLYLSDYEYYRIVALNLSAIVTNSPLPSLGASVVVGGSASNFPRTNTATASALASGASPYPSSTNTQTATATQTAGSAESESNSPFINNFTGATAQLNSWVDLIQF